MNKSHQAQINAHIAVQDMTEFMTDDALQFIAVELLQGTVGHRYDGVLLTKPSGESVDAFFMVEDIHLRHRHTGSDRHFFDHVDQLFFAWMTFRLCWSST